MVRIALCDDEQKILEQVSRHIEKYAQMQNEGVKLTKKQLWKIAKEVL